MAKSVVVNFIGDASKLKRAADESSSSIDKFQQKVGAAGKRMSTFVSVPIIGALTGATKSALDERKEISGLELAIKAATGARHASTKATEAWISKQQDATAFSDSEIRASFGKLIAVTHDYRKAQIASTFAADLARAKNIDLQTATDALTSAELGKDKALRKLGISTRDVHGKTLSLTEIIKTNSGAVKGSAAAFAEGAGKGDVMQHKMADLGESLGSVLIPAVDKLTSWLSKIASWFNNLSDGQKKMIVTVALVVAAIGPLLIIGSKLVTMFKAIKAASLFLQANPWVIALIAVVAAIVLVVKHFDKIKAAAKATWDFLVNTFKSAVNIIIGIIEKWMNVMTIPFRKASGLLSKVPGLGGLKKLSEEIRIPRLHGGGVMPGGIGDESLAILRGGERVSSSSSSAGAGMIELHVHIGTREIVRQLRGDLLREGRNNVSVGLA